MELRHLRYFLAIQSKGVAPRVIAEMNSNEAVLATVRFTALATILSDRIVAGTAGLKAVTLTGPALARTAALFWNRDGYRPAAARLVAEMIRTAYAPRPAPGKAPRAAA